MTPSHNNAIEPLLGTGKEKQQLLLELYREEYGNFLSRFSELLNDVYALYEGKWENRQACQVGYHTLDHALDVALATGRMIAGWNRQHDRKIKEDLFLYGIAASLFHDSGYLKNKEDEEGSGGKYTFNHVERSQRLAGQYLSGKGWPVGGVETVAAMIGLTEFTKPPEIEGKFCAQEEETVARMVATADLIAQMSDVDYIEHISDLFQEFQEAYLIEGEKNLHGKGVQVYRSAEEMIESTPSFYRNFVLPRLAGLGGMSRYLIAYYGEGRNPYLESIAANLGGVTGGYRLRWRLIGEILAELGVVTDEQIKAALAIQKSNAARQGKGGDSAAELKDRATAWVEQQLNGDSLGNILMQSAGLSPSLLRRGVIAQILPTDFTMRLNSRELLLLLHIMILLQNIQNGSWVFNQLLEIINELLECQASTILLADKSGRFLRASYASGARKDTIINKKYAIDKGLAGWVYLHDKPSTIDRLAVEADGAAFSESAMDRTVFRTILAVPLNIAGKRTGVIEALNKKEGNFSDHDINLISLAGNLLSQSLSAALWL